MSYVGIPFASKRHDTKTLFDRLEREQTPGLGDWAAIDLAGATVQFFAGDPDTGAFVFGGAAVVLTPVSATDPNVSFTPSPSQMALTQYPSSVMPIKLRCEWQITYVSGLIETIPAGKNYLALIIGEDVDVP